MLLGPVAVTAEDIKSFAKRFDPQLTHFADNAEQNTAVSGMFASGLDTVCMHMQPVHRRGRPYIMIFGPY